MILQRQLPDDMTGAHPLPGVAPLDMRRWLAVDDAYAAQMRRRQELLRTHRAEVVAQLSDADAAVHEALALVVGTLSQQAGFDVTDHTVICPDGRRVARRLPALEQICLIAQDDICILQKPLDAPEHLLSAAALCFPAGWKLSEKLGQPLRAIHDPVDDYTPDLARRVQRLFDGVRAGRPLWRFNRLWYSDPELFQPYKTDDLSEDEDAQRRAFCRSERQSIVRLPETGAVIFSIRTYVVHAKTARQQMS
ncbi:MAG: DUF3445 domain-containing protein [Pseudomonadota bacterium]